MGVRPVLLDGPPVAGRATRPLDHEIVDLAGDRFTLDARQRDERPD